jgi:hypothetical protein
VATGAAFRTSALRRFTLLELFEADGTDGGRVPSNFPER